MTTPLPLQVRCLALLVLLTVALRSSGYGFPRHLPFVEFLDSFGSAALWEWTLRFAFFGGVALAWLAGHVRTGCLLAGTALLLRVLGNMPAYSNGTLFTSLILVLIGLWDSPFGLTVLRAQCVILYAGAAVSKCLDPDWFNGRFVAEMLGHHLPPPLSTALAPVAPVAGVLTIAIEAAIAVTLAIPSLRPWGVALSASFHTFLLVLLNEDFGSFYYTVILSTGLLFTAAPPVVSVSAPSSWWPQKSVFATVRDAPSARGDWEVAFAGGAIRGLTARLWLTVFSLPGLAGLLAPAAAMGYLGRFKPRTALLALVFPVAAALWHRLPAGPPQNVDNESTGA